MKLSLTVLTGALATVLALPFQAETTDLYGVNLRPAAQSAPSKPPARYRNRVETTEPDCNCNPSLFSVIYLTGDSLPPLTTPSENPKIAQKNKLFEPTVLAVSVGTTVEFPNLDPFFHNVFSYSKTKKFDLGRYPKDASEEVTFDKPGLVSIFCEIHASMRAYVHVLETPYFDVTDEFGRFVIKDIRPGDYTLHVWQEQQSELTYPFSVTANGADSVQIEVGR